MASLFEIAKSGIQAYRQSLAVTGQNIANVSTEGYHKRDANLSEVGGTQGGVTNISDQSGLGVRVDEIRRSFNSFVSDRLRSTSSSFQRLELYSKDLGLLENTLLPSESDLGTFLGRFFDSLQEIAAAPEDLAPRTLAIESGKDLASSFNNYANQFEIISKGIVKRAVESKTEINLITKQLEDVNGQLKSSGASSSPNDLLDIRDTLLNELSDEISFTTEYGSRGEVQLRIGISGNGPIFVGENRAKEIQINETSSGLKILIGTGSEAPPTNQVSGGKLSGLIDFYSFVANLRKNVDELAERVTRDFNNVQVSGINLDGKLGDSMFFTGLPKISSSSLSQSDLSAEIIRVNPIASLSGQHTIKWNDQYRNWDLSNSNGKLVKSFNGNILNMDGFTINIKGNPKTGDEFIVTPDKSSAGSMKFNLSRPESIAAASSRLVESYTTNTGTAEITLEGSKERLKSTINAHEMVFTKSDTALVTTNFLKDGAVSSIGTNMDKVSFRSYAQQAQAKFVISDDQAKFMTSFSLSLTDGNSVSINFSSSDKGEKATTVEKLARILNMGITPGGTSFNFASNGLYASGSDGKLTISSANSDISSASASVSTTGTVNASIINPLSGTSEATNMHIFTREGRHVAGQPLTAKEIASLVTVKNGFVPEANYTAAYLNSGYRGMQVDRSSGLGDYILNTGAVAARSSNSTNSQTLSVDLFQDGISDASVSIPIASSSAYSLKQFNTNASKLGIQASTINRVLLSPIAISGSGTVSFKLSSGVLDAVEISATALKDDLTSLVTEINRVKSLTGVSALLTSDKKRVILENQDGDDISITNFSAPSSTTATVLNKDFSSSGASISIDSSDGTNSAVFSGSINFSSAVDFQITSDDGSSNLTGDASRNGLESSMLNISHSSTGEVLTIKPVSFGSADLSSGRSSGEFASSAKGTYGFNIPAISGGSSFTASINTSSLSDITEKSITKALLENIRGNSPDIRIRGSVLTSLPAENSKLSLNFEGQTYQLQVSGSNLDVIGGENDRIKAFFTPVNGWSGANTATEITTNSTWTLANSDNTFALSVDGTASNSITLAASTYNSNIAVADALQTAINADSNISGAGKSVTVSWNGSAYEIVSNNGTSSASVNVTSVDSTIENYIKLLATDGATKTISGYQVGITAKGVIDGSQITFPANSENNTAKTNFGIANSTLSIIGTKVDSAPADASYLAFTVNDKGWIGGAATAVSAASSWTLSNSDNTFTITVDGTTSGAVTLPAATYTSNAAVAAALKTAINADATLNGLSKSVNVLWDGTSYQIVSNSGSSSSANVSIGSVDATIEGYLKLTTANSAETTISSSRRLKFDSSSNTISFRDSSDNQIDLTGYSVQWDNTNKQMSIQRTLADSDFEITFTPDSSRLEAFGIKIHQHQVNATDEGIILTSGTGEPINISVDSGANTSRVGEALTITNLPPEELIVIINGGGARRISSTYDESFSSTNSHEENLRIDVDASNSQLVSVVDIESGHIIADRQLDLNGRFNVAGLNLRMIGDPKVLDKFSIKGNTNGTGDGRNIHQMILLQQDELKSEGKGDFQEIFSQLVASVGANVQSSEISLKAAESIYDSANAALSELSGVNLDDEAAQLIQYQQAYQASARVLQSARELFDTLISVI